jgi:hypothetical protein
MAVGDLSTMREQPLHFRVELGCGHHVVQQASLSASTAPERLAAERPFADLAPRRLVLHQAHHLHREDADLDLGRPNSTWSAAARVGHSSPCRPPCRRR